MKLFFSTLVSMLIIVPTFPQWTQVWTDDNDSTVVWGLFVKDSIVFIGTEQSSISGTFRSPNNGDNWFRNQYGLTGYAIYSNSFTSKDSFVYAATYDGVFRTIISDTIWTFAGNGIPPGYSNNAIINHDERLFVVLSNASVYKSTNDGLSWEISSNGLPGNLANSYNIVNYNDTLILGTTAGVYRTTDDGDVWESISDSLGFIDVEGMCIVGNYLYIATINKIYRTNNNGISWYPINLPNYANTIASIDTFIFIGTSDGILRNSINSFDWDTLNIGLPLMTTVSKIFQNNKYLFISTYGKGVWRISLNNVLPEVKDTASHLPNYFYLYQNYPNPFNNITTIKYDIVKEQYVKMKIYDVLGREVTILLNEQKKPGSYEVIWEASNVSSGIYFYQLKTRDYVDTRKMILLK